MGNHLNISQQHVNRWEHGGTPLMFYQQILSVLGAEVRMPAFPFTDPYATRRGRGSKPRHKTADQEHDRP